jgi:hypothetical protein
VSGCISKKQDYVRLSMEAATGSAPICAAGRARLSWQRHVQRPAGHTVIVVPNIRARAQHADADAAPIRFKDSA